jgi:4a-hydroxytetrahydrobiopterin dehydratase
MTDLRVTNVPDQADELMVRVHLDVWVAPEIAEQRINGAVAAGGQVVADNDSPTFTVPADPEGNRVCVCTYLGR